MTHDENSSGAHVYEFKTNDFRFIINILCYIGTRPQYFSDSIKFYESGYKVRGRVLFSFADCSVNHPLSN